MAHGKATVLHLLKMSNDKTSRLSAKGNFSQRNGRSRITNTVNGVSQEKIVHSAKNFKQASSFAGGQA